MAKKLSAGILLHRRFQGLLQVFLVHPGGPFWAKKDLGAWSIPKGEHEADEDPLSVAKREFREETGSDVPSTDLAPLGAIKQRSGKVISAWSAAGELDPTSIFSNTFNMEWPPKSGRQQEFPEVDRAAWYFLPEARMKLVPGQVGFLDTLAQHLGIEMPSAGTADDSAVAKARDSKSDQGSLF